MMLLSSLARSKRRRLWEGLLRSLKNYQPPMLKEEELRGNMGKDDDFNGKNLASIRARRMQLWLIMKGTFIIAVVLLWSSSLLYCFRCCGRATLFAKPFRSKRRSPLRFDITISGLSSFF